MDVREKVAISRHANTGAYAFPCGEKLRDACGEVLDDAPGEAGEFYISNVIRSMIAAGEKVRLVRVSVHDAVVGGLSRGKQSDMTRASGDSEPSG